jgi:cytochrome d ubiquinol oxidase subunit II
MLTTIGPHWDGNEVWLLTAGGATFAAFPRVVRDDVLGDLPPAAASSSSPSSCANMGFEYRGKRNDDTWRARWDMCDHRRLHRRAPAHRRRPDQRRARRARSTPTASSSGNLFTLLNPMSLLGGLVVLGLCLTHGAFFIALKTTGEIRRDARALGTKVGLGTAGLAVVLLLWLGFTQGTVWSWITTAIAAVSLLAAIYA